MLVTNKVKIGTFKNNKNEGSIFKCQLSDWNITGDAIYFEQAHRQIGNYLKVELEDEPILEYLLKRQLSFLFCNNETVITLS